MGYSTEFKGVLKFKKELFSSELAKLNKFINGNDLWEFGYKKEDYKWRYIDLKLTDDFSGLMWNGAEKTYGMEGSVNFLIDKSGIDLQLEGEFLAQGEDYDDRWRLIIKDGRALKIVIPKTGEKVTCPLCNGVFMLNE